MKTTLPKQQLELIKKVLKKDSFELIFQWLEIKLPPNEVKNLEKMFIKWLVLNPTAFKMFIEEYENVFLKEEGIPPTSKEVSIRPTIL